MTCMFQIVYFTCISGKTEEDGEQVKQKIQKLESMHNLILCFLNILYFVKV